MEEKKPRSNQPGSAGLPEWVSRSEAGSAADRSNAGGQPEPIGEHTHAGQPKVTRLQIGKVTADLAGPMEGAQGALQVVTDQATALDRADPSADDLSEGPLEIIDTAVVARKTLEDTVTSILRYNRETLQPLARSFAFEPVQDIAETRGKPHVVFLGNHSSGKSTFINLLCGRRVQKTGLAPTDDGFTVLTFGERDAERDGEAVVSNPDLPYQSLRSFGPALVSHMRLKQVNEGFLRHITLVDSPGMIDAVRREDQRGYDFSGAVKWFADRADLILLFFDPDKPGTTGETMHILAEALQGMDHKILLVLNKVDRFEGIRDFARAYGALCWNLARVIKTKDLPHIFTTYMPARARVPVVPAEDFIQAREELIAEIKRTPERRAENVISRLDDYARRLRIHTEVINHVTRVYRQFKHHQIRWALLVGLLGLLLTVSSALFQPVTWLVWVFAVITIGATFGLSELGRRKINRYNRELMQQLPDLFEQIHHREFGLRERAEDLISLWSRTRIQTERAIKTLGLAGLPRLKNRERRALTRLVEDEVPAMRARLHRHTG
ncbi:MAG: dynamin family protein [Bradymonadales bacterium]|nr:dynamin family protein [Bradymonadales bacterium]